MGLQFVSVCLALRACPLEPFFLCLQGYFLEFHSFVSPANVPGFFFAYMEVPISCLFIAYLTHFKTFKKK